MSYARFSIGDNYTTWFPVEEVVGVTAKLKTIKLFKHGIDFLLSEFVIMGRTSMTKWLRIINFAKSLSMP